MTDTDRVTKPQGMVRRFRRYLFVIVVIPFGFLLFGGLSYGMLGSADPLQKAGGFFFGLLGVYTAALAPGAMREWLYELHDRSSADAAAVGKARTNWGIPLAPTVLALVGLLPWDAAYYTLLRIAMTTAAIVYLVPAFAQRRLFFATALAAVAVLFNPLIPVYLHDKAAWFMLDIIALVLLWVAAFRFRRSVDHNL